MGFNSGFKGLNSGKASCHSIQNIFSLLPLSKTIKIIMHKVTISHVIIYACGNISPKSREEQPVRVSENRVLGKIFELLRGA
jgi:hypothetical protein